MSEIKINTEKLSNYIQELKDFEIKSFSSCPEIVGGGNSIQMVENIENITKEIHCLLDTLISNTALFMQNLYDSYVSNDISIAKAINGGSNPNVDLRNALGIAAGAVGAMSLNASEIAVEAETETNLNTSGISAMGIKVRNSVKQAVDVAKQKKAEDEERLRQEQAAAEAARKAAEWNAKLEGLRSDPIFQSGNSYWTTGNYYKDGVYKASQCMAFALEAQERIYGRSGDARFPVSSMAEVQVGDALHYYSAAEKQDPQWGHWVFVIGKTETGNLIVAEGNAYDANTGARGVVVWNRELDPNNINYLVEVIR